jgi:hypothetical protein
VILGGNNGVVWSTIIPPQNFNIFGAWYSMTIPVKLFNGSRTYATYAIQTCPKLVANGKPLLCLQSVAACHRYTEAAVPQLERAILAKAAHDRVTLITYAHAMAIMPTQTPSPAAVAAAEDVANKASNRLAD